MCACTNRNCFPLSFIPRVKEHLINAAVTDGSAPEVEANSPFAEGLVANSETGDLERVEFVGVRETDRQPSRWVMPCSQESVADDILDGLPRNEEASFTVVIGKLDEVGSGKQRFGTAAPTAGRLPGPKDFNRDQGCDVKLGMRDAVERNGLRVCDVHAIEYRESSTASEGGVVRRRFKWLPLPVPANEGLERDPPRGVAEELHQVASSRDGFPIIGWADDRGIDSGDEQHRLRIVKGKIGQAAGQQQASDLFGGLHHRAKDRIVQVAPGAVPRGSGRGIEGGVDVGNVGRLSDMGRGVDHPVEVSSDPTPRWGRTVRGHTNRVLHETLIPEEGLTGDCERQGCHGEVVDISGLAP